MTKITRTALMSLGMVATLAAAGFASTPAQADTYYGRPYYQQPYQHHYQQPYQQPAYAARQLNERQIERRLERQGYHQVGQLRWNRGYVQTRAIDTYGRRAWLTVSPTTGHIVDARYHY